MCVSVYKREKYQTKSIIHRRMLGLRKNEGFFNCLSLFGLQWKYSFLDTDLDALGLIHILFLGSASLKSLTK